MSLDFDVGNVRIVPARKTGCRILCRICGSNLRLVKIDLPFEVSEKTTVIVKELPVVQCESCSVYLSEDLVFSRVEKLLSAMGRATELGIIRFAA